MIKINDFKKKSISLGLYFYEISLIEKLVKKNKGKLKIIGGNVRDLLLNKKISSSPDLVTDLKPDKIIKIFKKEKIKFVDTAKKYGCIVAIIGKVNIEITTLRKDVKPDGRWTKVIYTKNWFEDANRRDFTINSIYCDLKGNLFDPLNGINDLKKKKVIFIGNPVKRIEEDFLRILRFLRFSLKYSKNFEENGEKACLIKIKKIKTLSFERRFNEIKKIILFPFFEESINLDLIQKILQNSFEEEINFLGIKQLFTIERDNNLVDEIRRIKFFILYWNKDKKRKLKSIFNKHEFNRISSNLSFSNYKANTINEKLYYFEKINVLDQIIFDFLNKKISETQFKKINEIIIKWRKKKFPITGNDLIKLGLNKGVQLGRIIRDNEIWWIKKNFLPGKSECMKKIKIFITKLRREEET